MLFSGIIPPQHLKILSDALDEYCAANFILVERERGLAAEHIFSLFQSGKQTPEALMAALDLPQLQLKLKAQGKH